MHVNDGDKHVIKCKILIVFSFNIRVGSSKEPSSCHISFKTHNRCLGRIGSDICIRNVKFQHVTDHYIFFLY